MCRIRVSPLVASTSSVYLQTWFFQLVSLCSHKFQVFKQHGGMSLQLNLSSSNRFLNQLRLKVVLSLKKSSHLLSVGLLISTKSLIGNCHFSICTFSEKVTCTFPCLSNPAGIRAPPKTWKQSGQLQVGRTCVPGKYFMMIKKIEAYLSRLYTSLCIPYSDKK